LITNLQNSSDEALAAANPLADGADGQANEAGVVDQFQEDLPVLPGFQVGEVFIPLTSPPVEGSPVLSMGASWPPPEETGGVNKVGPVDVACAEGWSCDSVLQASLSNLATSRMPSFCADLV
jgi:hypothetical protein